MSQDEEDYKGKILEVERPNRSYRLAQAIYVTVQSKCY
jgi:hypothetical protein